MPPVARGYAGVPMTAHLSDPVGRPAFLCDAMLGSLARWLRFFGYDALFPQPGPDDHLLARRAKEEGRWLLTRDCELAAAGPRSMMVRARAREEVAEAVPPHVLTTAPRFRRCGHCGRVYWPGSHSEGILERMEAVVERLNVKR